MNKSLNNEKGAVLITMLLLLIVITLVGVIAINVSTVDIQIARYTRESSTAFGGAEAGVDIAVPVIENTLEIGTLSPSGAIGIISALDTTTLENEITGGSSYNTDEPSGSGTTCGPGTTGSDPCGADITINDINGNQVKIDIDRLYSYTLPGSNIGFASGYEGIGAGSAGGGTAILYRISSQAAKP